MKTEILKAIDSRYSPMIFDEIIIDDNELNLLFEAATFSASSYNAQPWRFIYGKKGTDLYSKLRGLMIEYNQIWSESAPLLVLALAKTIDDKGKDNYFALYDLGQSVSAMAIQASSMGLQIHQMAGYDMEKAKSLFNISDSYSLGAMIAVGYPGDKSKLEGHFLERANEPRLRMNVTLIAGSTDVVK